MEISAEKTKLTTNNTSGTNTETTSVKYLGSVITYEGSKPELSKIHPGMNFAEGNQSHVSNCGWITLVDPLGGSFFGSFFCITTK